MLSFKISLIGASGLSECFFSSERNASTSATNAPLMLAVLVPPSASNTSQSIQRVRSPSFSKFTIARKLRPISLWISTLRPSTFPDRSLDFRFPVLPGSMEYSADSQPFPLPNKKGGTD